MIPSLDAFLINELRNAAGCCATAGNRNGLCCRNFGHDLRYKFSKSQYNKRAAVIAVESPTATLQLDDFSMANMVSAAIFGDGAACVLMSSEEEATGPEILGEDMYHFFDATHLMGFDLTNDGLKMILDPDVPQTIADHFPKIIHPFSRKT